MRRLEDVLVNATQSWFSTGKVSQAGVRLRYVLSTFTPSQNTTKPVSAASPTQGPRRVIYPPTYLPNRSRPPTILFCPAPYPEVRAAMSNTANPSIRFERKLAT